jgi:hypothetical protein
MEDILTISKPEIRTDKKVRMNINREAVSHEKTKSNPIIDNLVAEGGENFFHYLCRLGLVNDSNLLVLSSIHHYYYDYNELEGVTTLINLKELNLINNLDSFLNTISNVLSPKTNFIGCFYDSKTQKGTGLSSRLYKKFINFLDSKVDNEIDQQDVSRLLESKGYEVIDMTEIDGLTYFRTKTKEDQYKNLLNAS